MKKSKLTLIKERVKKQKGRGWLNEYLCECGNTTFQRADTINRGVVTSCGCGHIKNTPPSDSLLTLTKTRVKKINRKIYNEYLCECGNTTIKLGVLVRNGSTKSCGCLKENFVPKNKKYYNPPKDSKLILIKEDCKKIEGGWLSKYKCQCGNIKFLNKSAVNCGEIKSCGCLHKEKTFKHGQSSHSKNTRIYSIWVSMRRRCREKKGYVDREIRVCKEWNENFLHFYEWSIKNGYTNKLQIDRINNNGNYEPSNCRWTTCKVNSNNRRSSLPKETIREIKILLKFGFGTSTIKQMMGKGAVSHIRAIRDGKIHKDVKI